MKFTRSAPDKPPPILISESQEYEVLPKVFCDENSINTSSSLQIIWSTESFTWAVGFTVIVNVSDKPLQFTLPVKRGVTSTVATIGSSPVLIAVKDGKSPRPDVDNPISGLSFVHE